MLNQSWEKSEWASMLEWLGGRDADPFLTHRAGRSAQLDLKIDF